MENVDKMKKDVFQLKFNSETKEWFVINVQDGLTKKSQRSRKHHFRIILKINTDEFCPGLSFKTYIECLNPKISLRES